MVKSTDLSKDDEEFVKLAASNNQGGGSVPSEDDGQPSDCGVKEARLNGDIVLVNKFEHAEVTLAANNEHVSAVSVEENSSTVIKNKISVVAENGSTVQDVCHKRTGNPASNCETDAVSGTKRPRITVDEKQTSVHIVYNSITRESKRKLEELLQQWSEWHARHNSSSHDSQVELESGEGTYFPVLSVGLDKSSAVSFWMDGQTKNSQSKEVIPLDNNSIPLYDRGYSFGLTSTDGPSNVDGGLEIVDGSRCFNCGSYNHALKECPKPRDNAAVNNARKQHKAKRNQNAVSRNLTRYYQDTPAGKFDGLRPGVLDAETRKLLGLKELDPPPWLNRMREIGYPPGYLDAEDDDDQPSGIEIFGEEVVVKQETEDGEALDMDSKPEPSKKKSVKFPGVNAPIPENADEWRWAARAWKFELPRSRSSNHRYHSSTESAATRPHHHEERWNRDNRYYNSTESAATRPHHHEERWNHDMFREDRVHSGSFSSSFSNRYTGYDDFSGHRNLLIHETRSSHGNDRWNPYSTDSKDHRHRSWR
ncbi:putative transcription factor interactor and regulator CCHC(Zn) family [Helianthus annuus]|nr:putative transcription factor interactor and regulator CCHC(Zn) family [Helianthus annuus]